MSKALTPEAHAEAIAMLLLSGVEEHLEFIHDCIRNGVACSTPHHPAAAAPMLLGYAWDDGSRDVSRELAELLELYLDKGYIDPIAPIEGVTGCNVRLPKGYSNDSSLVILSRGRAQIAMGKAPWQLALKRARSGAAVASFVRRRVHQAVDCTDMLVNELGASDRASVAPMLNRLDREQQFLMLCEAVLKTRPRTRGSAQAELALITEAAMSARINDSRAMESAADPPRSASATRRPRAHL